MTLNPVVVVVSTAQVKRNWLGCVITQAPSTLCGAARTKVPTLPINAGNLHRRRVLIVSALKPHPPRRDHALISVCRCRRELRVQVRFTGGFRTIAMLGLLELAENQWVVLSQQHYYTREL